MTFCYARITCVIWLRAGAQCSTPHDIDMPRIHFVTSRRSPAASMPGGCPAEHFLTEEPPRSRASPRTLLSSPCAVGVPTKLAVTSKRNVVKMTMSVIVGFVVCWTPYFVVSLVRIYSDYHYRLTTALSVSELMALGHSAINPLLYILFSTRAVRAAFRQLRQRVLPRCCLRRRRRGRGLGQAASHRPWVVTPEPSTASGDGDGNTMSVAKGCLRCRRKRLAGSRSANSGQRVVVFSSPLEHHHHHHHQCYPPHQRQQQPQQLTDQRRTMFRATWSADGVPCNSRHALVTTRSRYATTQSAPSGVQHGNGLDSSSAGFSC